MCLLYLVCYRWGTGEGCEEQSVDRSVASEYLVYCGLGYGYSLAGSCPLSLPLALVILVLSPIQTHRFIKLSLFYISIWLEYKSISPGLSSFE